VTPIDLAHAATELAFVPLDRLPEGPALLVVSVASGALALLAVKRTTDQRRLAAARDQLTSGVLEMRIYLDSPRRVLRAQWRVVQWTARYVAAALPAVLVLALPFTLLFVHLMVRHEVAPVPVGQDVLLKVEAEGDTLVLRTPPGVEHTASFTSVSGTFYARLRPTEPGRHLLELRVGDRSETKLLVAGDGRGASSPERRSGLATLWGVGVERGLTGGITRISIEHPAAHRSWFGMPWWLVWLVVSTGTALVLRRPMKVVI
jgi:hypothetical protein